MRQTCLCIIATCLYLFVRFASRGILKPTRTSTSEPQAGPQVETPRDGASETTRTKITSCRERAGQNARLSQKHCKAWAKHAHAWYIGARARLYARVCTVSIIVEISTPEEEKKKRWPQNRRRCDTIYMWDRTIYPMILPEFITRPILIVPTYPTFVCTTPTTWHYF